MNKIDKYLRKLQRKERAAIIEILDLLDKGILKDLDLKKMKGYDNYFRVRKGDTRIIFNLDINGRPIIRKIERRSDTTY